MNSPGSYIPLSMGTRKRVALVAHDNRKSDLLDWARFNRAPWRARPPVCDWYDPCRAEADWSAYAVSQRPLGVEIISGGTSKGGILYLL